MGLTRVDAARIGQGKPETLATPRLRPKRGPRARRNLPSSPNFEKGGVGCRARRGGWGSGSRERASSASEAQRTGGHIVAEAGSQRSSPPTVPSTWPGMSGVDVLGSAATPAGRSEPCAEGAERPGKADRPAPAGGSAQSQGGESRLRRKRVSPAGSRGGSALVRGGDAGAAEMGGDAVTEPGDEGLDDGLLADRVPGEDRAPGARGVGGASGVAEYGAVEGAEMAPRGLAGEGLGFRRREGAWVAEGGKGMGGMEAQGPYEGSPQSAVATMQSGVTEELGGCVGVACAEPGECEANEDGSGVSVHGAGVGPRHIPGSGDGRGEEGAGALELGGKGDGKAGTGARRAAGTSEATADEGTGVLPRQRKNRSTRRDMANMTNAHVVKQKWTEEEVRALKMGVKRFGVGRWRHIQNDPVLGEILACRSNVDLKDKWRNLTSVPQVKRRRQWAASAEAGGSVGVPPTPGPLPLLTGFRPPLPPCSLPPLPPGLLGSQLLKGIELPALDLSALTIPPELSAGGLPSGPASAEWPMAVLPPAPADPSPVDSTPHSAGRGAGRGGRSRGRGRGAGVRRASRAASAPSTAGRTARSSDGAGAGSDRDDLSEGLVLAAMMELGRGGSEACGDAPVSGLGPSRPSKADTEVRGASVSVHGAASAGVDASGAALGDADAAGGAEVWSSPNPKRARTDAKPGTAAAPSLARMPFPAPLSVPPVDVQWGGRADDDPMLTATGPTPAAEVGDWSRPLTPLGDGPAAGAHAGELAGVGFLPGRALPGALRAEAVCLSRAETPRPPSPSPGDPIVELRAALGDVLVAAALPTLRGEDLAVALPHLRTAAQALRARAGALTPLPGRDGEVAPASAESPRQGSTRAGRGMGGRRSSVGMSSQCEASGRPMQMQQGPVAWAPGSWSGAGARTSDRAEGGGEAEFEDRREAPGPIALFTPVLASCGGQEAWH